MAMETLDLHNVRHHLVVEKVSKFLNWAQLPCRIITGNSKKMKQITKEIVKKYGYICYNESTYNHGSLLVVEPPVIDFE